MKIKGAAVQEVGAAAAGRGLYEAEAQRQATPGRSEIAYMQQHKYTPLDVRIIIITAAILLLLLSVLFLNFFIRWAIRRFFLVQSQKPLNGLSKRQVQALPSFIYSSSKPPIFASSHPSHPPKFYHDLLPITCHGDIFGHDLKPFPSHSCHDLHPTKIGSTKANEFHHTIAPIESKVDEVDHKPPSQLSSTKVDEVDHDPPTKFGTLEVDEVIEVNNPPMRGQEDANDANSLIGSTKANVPTVDSEVKANSLIGSTKANVPTIDSEVKANSSTFKDGSPIIGCTKTNEMCNHGDDNASSPAPCPICLVDYADGDTIRVLPTCRHFFHIGCIDMWLTKSSSCPACRANILEATRTPIKHPTLQVQVIITTSH